jgi:hypothetical protein
MLDSIPPRSLNGEAGADRAEGVAFDYAGVRQRGDDGVADMGELRRTACGIFWIQRLSRLKREGVIKRYEKLSR